MKYKGLTLNTYSEIVSYVLRVDAKEQEEFVEAYCRTGVYARSNIGYISGYYDPETCLKIQKIFKTAHPIFGRRIPSTSEAFDAGKKLAMERT